MHIYITVGHLKPKAKLSHPNTPTPFLDLVSMSHILESAIIPVIAALLVLIKVFYALLGMQCVNLWGKAIILLAFLIHHIIKCTRIC